MSAFTQRGRCSDCFAEFALHAAIKRFVGDDVPAGEVDLDICPECGSYNVLDASMELSCDESGDDTCTVTFRINKGQLEGQSFLYALACRIEGWKGVEVLQIQLPDAIYEPSFEVGESYE